MFDRGDRECREWVNHTRSKPIRPCHRYATCLACSISWFVSVHLPFLPISTAHPITFPAGACGGRGWSRQVDEESAHGQADGSSRAIQAMMRFTTFRCRSGESSTPRGTLHHLFRHPRQQVAVACCAVKTGCPRIGVWRPSFSGQAGASRCRTKSSAWRRRASRPCFPM